MAGLFRRKKKIGGTVQLGVRAGGRPMGISPTSGNGVAPAKKSKKQGGSL